MSTFDPDRFLAAAKSLSGSDDETDVRISIGRAYYAIFLRWREKVAKRLKIDPHDLGHEAFRRFFSEKHPLPLTGPLVSSLWERRICADYRLTNPALSRQRNMMLQLDSALAKKSVQEAERLNALLIVSPP